MRPNKGCLRRPWFAGPGEPTSAVLANKSESMAPASIDAFGGALASFAFGLAGVIGNGVSAFGKRQARQWRLRRAARAELLLALLAARMSAIAYVDSHSEVRDALRAPELANMCGGTLELLHFKRQRTEEKELLPQWFLARGGPPIGQGATPRTPPTRTTTDVDASFDARPADAPEKAPMPAPNAPATALFLVFRGTWSKMDLLRDLCVEPVAHGGRRFHGGFLSGVRDDRELHAQLRQALLDQGGGGEPLYVVRPD